MLKLPYHALAKAPRISDFSFVLFGGYDDNARASSSLQSCEFTTGILEPRSLHEVLRPLDLGASSG